jgi:hypothetical protein
MLTFVIASGTISAPQTELCMTGCGRLQRYWRGCDRSSLALGYQGEEVRFRDRKGPLRSNSQARQDPNDWGLDGYIKVARVLAPIEEETEKQAGLAKGFRNLIHPGRSARLARVCDRGTALSALAAVELVVRDLS